MTGDLFRPRMALSGLRIPREIYAGVNSSVVLRSIVAARALVVMSRSVASTEAGGRLLERVGATDSHIVLPDWNGEPSVDSLTGLVAQIENFRPDVMIAVGGGSIIDGAKLARLLAECPDTSLRESGSRPLITVRPEPPTCRLVAIPTTAGSGAEVSTAAVVTVEGRKVPVVSASLMPDAVVLDPSLLVGMPRAVAYASLLDAVTHALEGYVSTVRNPIMDTFAESVIRDVSVYSRQALDDCTVSALERIQVTSMLAGVVQAQSLVGASHAVAHNLNLRYGHGEANSLALPHVIRLNAHLSSLARQRYGLMAELAAVGDDFEDLAIWVESMRSHGGLEDLAIVDDPQNLVMRIQVDVAARTNPVPVDQAFAERLVELMLAETDGR